MKQAAVVDSSSLIFAFKIGEVGALLRKKYSCLVLPNAVYEEAVARGKERGFSEVEKIEAAIAEGFVKVEAVPPAKTAPQTALGRGELEAILLAAKKKADLLCDDRKAAAAAKLVGVNAFPLSAFVVAAAKQGVLPKKTAKKALDDLVLAGYRLKSDVYIRLANEIEKNSLTGN